MTQSVPKANVLLVDDKPENLTALEAVLDNQGLNLVKASTGRDALRCVLEQDFAVILLDVIMPEMDGFETAELIRARERTSHTPIIFVTAVGTSELERLRGYTLGGVDYLLKPFNPEILRSKVRVFTELFAAHEALRQAHDGLEQKVQERTAELLASQQTLRDTALQLSGLVEAATDAVFEIDAEGTILIANTAAHRMFGWPSGDLLGRNITVIMPPNQHDAHQVGLKRFLETGEGPLVGTITEVTCLRRDGTEVSGELSLASLMQRDRSRRFIGIVRDITQRRQMERHNQRLEQLATLGQLVGGIAHEIKNPLFVVTGRLQLLREKLARGERDQLDQDFQKIEEAAQRMTGIVQRFLSLARPWQPALQVCSVPALLQHALDFAANELMKRRIKVVTQFMPDLPSCLVDPAQLSQAFLNLIMNAMQAMSEAHGQGTLTVSIRCCSPRIEVRIQDDGPGIAPEHRAKLFEPFFSTKPPEQGTGLGLWTVRMIVTAAGGSTTCETEVGQGTTFIVLLPVAEEPTRGQGDAGKGKAGRP